MVVFTEYCTAGWPLPTLSSMAAPLSLIASLHAAPPVRTTPDFLVQVQAPTPTSMKRAISLPLIYRQPGQLVFDRLWSIERSESRGAHVQVERFQLDIPSYQRSGSLRTLSGWNFVQRHFQQRLSLSSADFPSLMPGGIAVMKPVFRSDLDRRYLDLAFILAATGRTSEQVEWVALDWSDSFDVNLLQRLDCAASQYTLPCIASGRMAYLTREWGIELRLLQF